MNTNTRRYIAACPWAQQEEQEDTVNQDALNDWLHLERSLLYIRIPCRIVRILETIECGKVPKCAVDDLPFVTRVVCTIALPMRKFFNANEVNWKTTASLSFRYPTPVKNSDWVCTWLLNNNVKDNPYQWPCDPNDFVFLIWFSSFYIASFNPLLAKAFRQLGHIHWVLREIIYCWIRSHKVFSATKYRREMTN